MPMKHPEKFIIQAVKKYEAGTSIKELSQSLKNDSCTLQTEKLILALFLIK